MIAHLTAVLFLAGLAPAPEVEAGCSRIEGLEDLLRPGEVLLVGEIHGTEQAPAFVATVACHAARRKLALTVAVELPVSENDRLSAFLDSSGDAAAVADLLDSTFWKQDYQDGRASQAMLDLFQSIRSLRRSGAELRLFAIDDGGRPGGRDKAMASALAAGAEASPASMVVALTGNLHNRLTVGNRFDSQFIPMGAHLKSFLPDRTIRSLNLEHQGGEAWVCFGGQAADCGVKKLGGSAVADAGIVFFAAGGEKPYSGAYNVGPITASLPAKDR